MSTGGGGTEQMAFRMWRVVVKILNKHFWLFSKGWPLVIWGALGKGLTAPRYKNERVVKCHTVPGAWPEGLVAGLC